MKKRLLLFLCGLVLLWTGPAVGQEIVELKPVTKTYAFTNVTVVQKPGQILKSVNLVVKDGSIAAIGKDIPIPPDAKIVGSDSLYIYSGFIDGATNVGVPRPKSDAGQSQEGRRRGPPPGVKDRGNPPNKVAGILPERSVVDLLNPEERSVAEMRKIGFTTAHAVPRGQMLPGKGALILLKGKSGKEMVLKDETSLFAQLSGARGVYPATVIGVMSKFRDLYKQAELAQKHEKAYRENPSGMKRPNYDEVHQAFYGAIDGQRPIFFNASDVKSIHRVMMLQKDLGFPLVLANVKQGWHVADQIKNAQIPVFLSLDLPEFSDTKKKKEATAGAKAVNVKNPEVQSDEKAKLEKRRKEEMGKHLRQAAVFAEKGIDFGFSTISAKSKDIRGNLLKLIKNGLSEEQILAALTVIPSKLLGVDKILGTVEKGKMANLLVTDKPYFEEKANVRYVMVEGEVFEYEVKEKKKGDTKVKADPVGSWSYQVDADGQTMEGQLVIKKNEDIFSGTISNPMTNESSPVNDVELAGNKLSFSTKFNDGSQTVSVSFSVVIEGNNFEGSVSADGLGTFDIEGERASTPR